MAANLRSKVDTTSATEKEQVLGTKATGGVDADADHVPNVAGGLKRYVHPNSCGRQRRVGVGCQMEMLMSCD